MFFYASAQFDGEEQKTGARASVFFSLKLKVFFVSKTHLPTTFGINYRLLPNMVVPIRYHLLLVGGISLLF